MTIRLKPKGEQDRTAELKAAIDKVRKAGETLRFIKGATLEPGAEVKVESVKMLAKDKVEIAYSAVQPATCNLQPADYGLGDAVENATWQPNVVFSKNTVRNSTPRATLFTTPGLVVCMNNVFENVAGQPIYLAGDAWDWYESGASRDVIVQDNVVVKNNKIIDGNERVVTECADVKVEGNTLSEGVSL